LWGTLLLIGVPAMVASAQDLVWHHLTELDIEGKAWQDTATPYDRMPPRAEGVVPDAVWSLSQCSAGLCARFVTDASSIHVRWTLRTSRLSMDHMPATGVSGVDLYVNDAGVWRWIGIGRPQSSPNIEKCLASGIPEGTHEYVLYLPLYNGVTSVEIGVPTGASFEKAPPYPADRAKPILFYGTSITQGGCAARPGMAYPAIVGRFMRRPTINLGFSGNGRMDPEVVDLLAEIDVAAYVIDCCPNLTPDVITERTEPLVLKLRAARPDTPIVLVENIRYQAGAFLPKTREAYTAKNAALFAAFNRLVEKSIMNLHYVPCDALLGDDGEATVDGTHATDLGFWRMAKALVPALRDILEAKK
jgi:hypothetical protein